MRSKRGCGLMNVQNRLLLMIFLWLLFVEASLFFAIYFCRPIGGAMCEFHNPDQRNNRKAIMRLLIKDGNIFG
jgi:hypothetical protein